VGEARRRLGAGEVRRTRALEEELNMIYRRIVHFRPSAFSRDSATPRLRDTATTRLCVIPPPACEPRRFTVKFTVKFTVRATAVSPFLSVRASPESPEDSRGAFPGAAIPGLPRNLRSGQEACSRARGSRSTYRA
jgi:hypothetical protein